MNPIKALVAGSIAGAVLTIVGEPAVADGDTSLVTCLGTAEQTYDPGLTLMTRDTHISADNTFHTCVDLSGSHTPVTSAVIVVDYTTPANCLAVEPVMDTTVTVEWGDGRHSIAADSTFVVSRTGGQTIVVNTGTITSGLFAGNLLSVQVTYPSLDLPDCLLGAGVTHVTGTAGLAVSPL